VRKREGGNGKKMGLKREKKVKDKQEKKKGYQRKRTGKI
jgi:hypothetical protein